MKAMGRLFLFAGLAGALHATSVAPVDRECPVCSRSSVGLALMSYSNFGEPERDLSDHRMFARPGVEICPHDLFATWPGRRNLNADEKSDLEEFLKAPTIELTHGEKEALGADLDRVRESRWVDLLWARTCDARRRPDPRQRWLTAMNLHFAGKFAKEPWEKRLAAHFTREAIRELELAGTADWPGQEEKRVFAYLRGELLRHSGEAAAAKAVFGEVMRREEAFAGDEESSWIGRWAREQSLRIDAAAENAAALGRWLLKPPPDPWRDRKAASREGWEAHRVVLDILSTRAGDGDHAASDVLWKALDRKPARLLAIAETTTGIDRWREHDPRWEKWFDELLSAIEAERLPDLGREERNPERVFNVLGRAVGKEGLIERRERSALAAAVAKAASGGGLPDTGWKGAELLAELKKLMDEDPARRDDAARIMIRIFKQAGERKEDFGYSPRAALVSLAKMPEPKNMWSAELGGEWRSDFWKATFDYLAGAPDAAGRLTKHPLATRVFSESDGRVGEDLLWQLFAARRDPVWKDKALKALEKESWLKDEVTNYAFATGDADLRKALIRRAERLRAGEIADTHKEMALYEIMTVEESFVREKLGRLPIR